MKNYADIVIFENKFIAMIKAMGQAARKGWDESAKDDIDACGDALETIACYMSNVANYNMTTTARQVPEEEVIKGRVALLVSCVNAMQLLNETYARREGGILLEVDLEDVAAVQSFAVRLSEFYWKRAMDRLANEQGQQAAL